MHLGSFVNISSRLLSASGAKLFGSWVAHEQLLKHFLLSEDVAGLDMFSNSASPQVLGQERELFEAAVDELFTTTQRRPLFSSLERLPARVTSLQPYFFISNVPRAHRLAQLRRNMAGPQFGVVSVTYSIHCQDFWPNYHYFAFTAGPQDVIVVPSTAALRTVCAILDQCTSELGTVIRPRITRIPFGCHEPATSVDRAASRKLLALDQDALIVLYFGRLSEEYKADLAPLLLVFSKLRARFPAMKLIVAGHNHDRYAAKLRTMARALELQSALVIVEDPPDAIRELLYAATDIYVAPSDNIQESFGLSILEAMRWSLPVVASDWNGYRDIVQHGQTGFLVPTWLDRAALTAVDHIAAADASSYGPSFLLAKGTVVDSGALYAALDHLAANPERRREMGANGRRVAADEFGWCSVARRYVELMRELEGIPDEPMRAPTLPMEALFGHFATSLLREDVLVYHRQDPPAKPDSFRSWIGAGDARLLEGAATPRPLSYWSSSGDRARVLRLIKLGVLRLVHPSPGENVWPS